MVEFDPEAKITRAKRSNACDYTEESYKIFVPLRTGPVDHIQEKYNTYIHMIPTYNICCQHVNEWERKLSLDCKRYNDLQ